MIYYSSCAKVLSLIIMIKIAVILSLATIAFGAPQLRSVPTLDGRIVGGKNANIADYPYQISLQYSGSHICGGSLIAKNLVLTAAHCTDGSAASRLSIRAGSTNRGSGGQVIAVSRIIQNSKYNSRTIDYDLSILQLASSVSVANAVPIALRSAGSNPTAGSTTTITGWGTLTDGGSLPTVLQVVEVPVVSQANCRSAYGTSSITDRMFCAGITAGGKDACQGDSGGPAVVGGVLSGVVSWGNGCARPSYPGVYSNVASMRSWITDNTGI